MLFGVLCPQALAEAKPADGQTLALIIGWNGGGFGLPPLRYADDDALRFATILQDEPSAPLPPNVLVLTELDAETRARIGNAALPFEVSGRPTRARVMAAFDDLSHRLSASQQRQRVFVIYAGHGLTNRLLLAPQGTEEAAFSGHELRVAVARLSAANPNAEISLFVDACRSQSLFTMRGTEGLDGPDLGGAIATLESRSLGAHVGVITAATSGKPAGELRRLESGYFSHVLLSGIVGGADANEDDHISFGELAAFVAFHTQAMMGQLPWFDPPSGNLSAVTFDHSSRTRRLVLPRNIEGRFEVRGPQGRPVFAELWKGRDQRIRLSLPQGNYRVLQSSTRDGEREVVVKLPSGAAVDLGAAAWQPTMAEARGEQGEPDAVPQEALGFRAPFSSEVVATLKAGFDAGRTPALVGESPTIGRNWLSVVVGLSSAPLALPGVSYGGGVHFRRLLSRWFVATEFASHVGRYASTTEDYTLLQTRLMAQSGAWHLFGRNTWGFAWLEAGATNLLRFADRTSGDRFAPRVGGGLSLHRAIGAGWLLGISPRAFVQWIDVSQQRTTDKGVTLEFEASYAF